MTPENPKATLKFPDLTEAVLKKLLEYCYTLQVSAIHKTPFELLLAAHRYNLTGLQGKSFEAQFSFRLEFFLKI